MCAGVAWKVVLVVEGGRAAVFDQIANGGQRGVIKTRLVEPRKQRIDAIQPLQHGELRPVQLRVVAHKALEKVVVGVDQARIDKMPAGVDGLGARRYLRGGNLLADARDRMPATEQNAMRLFNRWIEVNSLGSTRLSA